MFSLTRAFSCVCVVGVTAVAHAVLWKSLFPLASMCSRYWGLPNDVCCQVDIHLGDWSTTTEWSSSCPLCWVMCQMCRLQGQGHFCDIKVWVGSSDSLTIKINSCFIDNFCHHILQVSDHNWKIIYYNVVEKMTNSANLRP
jgi:hypothetical protein